MSTARMGATTRVGITGHRGLSAAVEKKARAGLAALVREYGGAGLVGVSCIADGPDAWFAQAVLERGGRIEVVIPEEEYRENLPASYHAEYDELLRRASEVHSTGMKESNSEAHQAGSEILVGIVDLLVAVWDGRPARGYGGTADVVAYAERTGVPVRILWPAGATR